MGEQAKPTVSFDEFRKLDLRIAKVTGVSDHPNADKLIVLDIDLGGEPRQLVAGLKPYLADPQSPTVPPNMSLNELFEVFTIHNVAVLPVTQEGDAGRVIGIVEQRDLLRALHLTRDSA